jgi:peptidyl-prolyl cis-trans isomerase SurA
MMLRHCLAAVALLALADARAQTPPAPANDGLNLRFADGIVAIVEDKVITVDDVRRDIQPLIPQLQHDAANEEAFNRQLEQLQDNVIQQEIDKVLIIKDFKKDDKKHIPDSYIDSYIADQLADQFDNDRSKFLSYLRSRGLTMKEYRTECEDNIIYHYQEQEQRKTSDVVSPVRVEQYYKENKDQFYQEDQVSMRMIQLTKIDGATDDELKARADTIEARFHSGEKFEDLAKEFSQDAHRSKGGDWGWQKRTDLNPEFSEPLFALQKNEATPPIVTKDGVFILYCGDRKYAGIQPLSAVHAQIEQVLSAQMTQSSMEHWLERLRRNGYVKHF